MIGSSELALEIKKEYQRKTAADYAKGVFFYFGIPDIISAIFLTLSTFRFTSSTPDSNVWSGTTSKH